MWADFKAKIIFLESSTESPFSVFSAVAKLISKSFSTEANSSKISDLRVSNFCKYSEALFTATKAWASLGIAFLNPPPSIEINWISFEMPA